MSVSEASRLNQDAQARFAAIDADTRLTAEAKTTDKLRVWASLDLNLRTLRARDQAAANRRRADLERQLFGLSATATATDIIGFRDAETRAAAITSEAEAARLMDSARRAGDEQMVRAIAGAAYRSGWTELQQAYTAEVSPEQAEAAAEFNELNSASAQTASFIQGWAFMPTSPGVKIGGRELTEQHDLRNAAVNAGIAVDPRSDGDSGNALLRIAGTRSANPYGNDIGTPADVETTGDAA